MKRLKSIIPLLLLLALVGCEGDDTITFPESRTLDLKKISDSLNITLRYGGETIINNELTIKFEAVLDDSRCPIDAICVWAGNGEVKLKLTLNGGNSESMVLNTLLEPRAVKFGSYKIFLQGLNPSPMSNCPIAQEDYSINLVIKPENAPEKPSPIVLVSMQQPPMIKRDELMIRSYELKGDLLTFDVSYSGGCNDHIITLFAYKEIMKSNPQQLQLALSHWGMNDMCDAIISQRRCFDLSALKNYLKEHLQGYTTILLNLHDPAGKPVGDKPLEYKFN
jgi:hypothetical protein